MLKFNSLQNDTFWVFLQGKFPSHKRARHSMKKVGSRKPVQKCGFTDKGVKPLNSTNLQIVA